MARPPIHDDDQGFTLVEVLVASLVLVTGMLAVLTVITQAQTTTWSTQARTNANAIVRQVVEGARAVPYEQLVTATLATSLQTKAGLGDDQLATPGWQLRRGGFTYTVSVGVCAMDDPRDNLGTHEAGLFCVGDTDPAVCTDLLRVSGLVGLPGAGANAAAVAGLGNCGLDVDFDGQVDGLVDVAGSVCVGTCAAAGVDTSPADAKRIVVLVRWDRGAGSRYVLQATTAANPGLAGAPAIAELYLAPPASSPVTDRSINSLQVNATTSASAATVAAYLDGTQKGTATGSGTVWSFTWPLGDVSTGSSPSSGEVVDGSYLVGLKAYDANGQFGQSRSLTVLLNRREPYAPKKLLAGRNGSGVVELEWQPSVERDVELYRGYRASGSSWILVCTTTATRCQDTAAPAPGFLVPPLQYTVVAVDRDPAPAKPLREGALATTASASSSNTSPNPPTGLTATSQAGTTVLTWTASPGDPDLLDSVNHYAIYRDGALFADRYDRTSDVTQTQPQTTWTDTQVNGQTHVYRVAAVDTQLAESTKLGPVTK